MGYVCFRCKKTVGHYKDLLRHLKAVHHINSASTYFQCSQDGCGRTFNYLHSYRRHLLQQHPQTETEVHADRSEDQQGSVRPTESELEDPSEENEVGHNDEEWDEFDENGVTDRVAVFLAKLKAKPSQTFAAVNYVVQETSDLVSDIVGSLHRKTMSILEQLGQSDTTEIQVLNSQFQNAAAPFQGLETDYKQINYFTESGCLIKPIDEPFAGISYIQQRDPMSGTVQQVPVRDTFQRVPLRPLLKKILETPGTLEKVLEWQKREADALQDFRDGSLFKSKSLLFQDVAIPIVLYNDDCETVNPLGSKTGIHKLGLIYFTLKCLPPDLLSNLNSVFLAGVYKSDDVKTYGIDAVLTPIVEELKDMEVNGIEVNTPNFHGKFTIWLAQVCGDNLGLNAILGYNESFSANSVCRWCRIHKVALQRQTVEDPSLLRNPENYQADLALQNPFATGLKRDSVLNSLRYYHVVQNVAPDIMHDILEGVAGYETKLVLNSLIEEKLVTLDQVNSRLTSFDYGFADSHNKPSTISKQELKNPDGAMRQTASQMWCLLRYLPLMLGDLIPEDNAHLELLLLLLSCMELIFSTSLTPAALAYLTHLIKDHHTLYLELYPERNLKPKHHFMVHYPGAIRALGPIIHFWAMRFEAKHGFFKRVSHVTCNFRNICKTMAFRHQMLLCYNFLSGTLFAQNIEVGAGYTSIVGNLDGYRSIQNGIEGIPLTAEVFVPTWVKIKGTTYRPGMTVFVSYTSDGEPQFATIKTIVTLISTVKLVVQMWHTKGFSRHHFAYSLSPDYVVKSLDAKHLLDHHPYHVVQSYNKNDALFLSLRYRLM